MEKKEMKKSRKSLNGQIEGGEGGVYLYLIAYIQNELNDARK